MTKRLSKTAYPVDDAALRSRRRTLALTSPITWLPYLALAAASYFLHLSWWVTLILFIALTLALIVYWTQRITRLDPRITKELLDESNAAQEDVLVQVIHRLQKSGHDQYGATLSRFLKVKKAVETSLQSENEALFPFRTEMRALVDSLCESVAEELESLARVQERLIKPRAGLAEEDKARLTETQRSLVEKISSAFKTLTDCEHRLLDVLHPISDPTSRPSKIDHIVEKLRTETELVQRVQQRLSETE